MVTVQEYANHVILNEVKNLKRAKKQILHCIQNDIFLT